MSAAAQIDAPGPWPPDWPWAELSRVVQAGPYRWHVQEMVRGRGPVAVLLHGAGASTHSWRDLMPRLAQRWRVIAVDLPGQGYTEPGPGRRGSLSAMAQDLAALFLTLEITPHILIGHSAGGALALQLCRTLAHAPRGVVVLNGALEDFRGPAGVVFPIMARMLAFNPFAGLFLAQGATPATVDRLIAATGAQIDAEGLRYYQRLIGRRRHVDATLEMMARWSLGDLSRALPQIDLPALFLHGARDLAVAPDVARRAARAMPDARLKVFEGVGHLVQEEAPDRASTAIGHFADEIEAT